MTSHGDDDGDGDDDDDGDDVDDVDVVVFFCCQVESDARLALSW